MGKNSLQIVVVLSGYIQTNTVAFQPDTLSIAQDQIRQRDSFA
jgi:hypothetical protein